MEETEKVAIKRHPLMCFKCRKSSHIKADCPVFNKDKFKKKKKVMCSIWDGIDKSESEEDADEENESFGCFMVVSNEVTS